ncbi:hypothetical protein CDL12_12492 [Handroanthus impetiginosus]|uniref:PB1 domain-containing protein n=1 Tax=Handroanthus impetiginosus TaxID=429701 RepID=A0A2G9HBJ3_9LAMI|nr:hypothetical protein CDL12_12492 [Handroanthus impetiginosus]
MVATLNSSTNSSKTIKFLYSYGGRIVPRRPDGILRYVGGYTRVLAVDRSVTFSELMVKFGESCGSSMDLKCKLPTEDLDLLISIKSDDELKSVIDEYDRASPEAKIRALLFPIKPAKKVSVPSSPMSCFDFPSPRKQLTVSPDIYTAPACAAYYGFSPAVGYPVDAEVYHWDKGKSPWYLHHMHRQTYFGLHCY